LPAFWARKEQKLIRGIAQCKTKVKIRIHLAVVQRAPLKIQFFFRRHYLRLLFLGQNKNPHSQNCRDQRKQQISLKYPDLVYQKIGRIPRYRRQKYPLHGANQMPRPRFFFMAAIRGSRHRGGRCEYLAIRSTTLPAKT